MAAFNKFNLTVEDWLKGLTVYGTDTFRIMLTNTLPGSSNHVYADVSAGELTTTGGYTVGGVAIATALVNTSGLETVTATSVSPTWTGSGGGFGPFRYVIFYNSSSTTKTLQCWFDYGSAISVNAGDTFTVNFGANLFTLQ